MFEKFVPNFLPIEGQQQIVDDFKEGHEYYRFRRRTIEGEKLLILNLGLAKSGVNEV